jgi:hypothetical protein
MGFPNNSEGRGKTSKSTNGEFGCSGNASCQLSSQKTGRGDIQLKESPTFFNGIRRHDINQILDGSTIEVVPMICLYD